MARRVREDAMSKRAALRRRALADYEIPSTEGPHDTAETASLIFTGAPAGAAGKAAARFGPKGFKVAKKAAESVAGYVKKVLKPIIVGKVKGK